MFTATTCSATLDLMAGQEEAATYRDEQAYMEFHGYTLWEVDENPPPGLREVV